MLSMNIVMYKKTPSKMTTLFQTQPRSSTKVNRCLIIQPKTQKREVVFIEVGMRFLVGWRAY